MRLRSSRKEVADVGVQVHEQARVGRRQARGLGHLRLVEAALVVEALLERRERVRRELADRVDVSVCAKSSVPISSRSEPSWNSRDASAVPVSGERDRASAR